MNFVCPKNRYVEYASRLFICYLPLTNNASIKGHTLESYLDIYASFTLEAAIDLYPNVNNVKAA